MIKITETTGILKTCDSCGSTENTKIIEIGNGALMICLCDECLKKLAYEIAVTKHKELIKVVKQAEKGYSKPINEIQLVPNIKIEEIIPDDLYNEIQKEKNNNN